MSRVEVAVYRDPDGTGDVGTAVEVFIDGAHHPDAEVTVVDPGVGYDREDWLRNRAYAVDGASPHAAVQIAAFYDAGAETAFMTV
ncbi:hypothetical protein [Amycolatopsis sp. CA-230715]|uniref:hypothetical protein n=1 Tax=Amycolatopsis sp. CA-230715 TaxID=2745196 RepID=UPI001C034AC8|nr:hypothetical protein [Amycolatopsis sp. CA-230715]QWF85686.1 hypothetical protein HUW46_09166 [Amycolatopsis sp. CA-230715]